jgi:hypothetical protein
MRSTLSFVAASDTTPAPRAYAERRTHEGLSKPEIIRCLIGEVSVMRPGIGLDRGFSVVSGDGLVAEPL